MLKLPSSPSRPQRSRPAATPWRFAAIGGRAALLFAACSCAGANHTAADTRTQFDAFKAADARAFDDQIEAAAVGLADVAVRPNMDPALRIRTQSAELVARVRVSTVSADSVGGRPVYRVSLSAIDRLVGGGLGDDHLELVVRPESPSFGIVKWLDTGMIGKTFVGFFQRYAGVDEPQLHFHLAPDTPDVVAAIGVAKALHDVRGK